MKRLENATCVDESGLVTAEVRRIPGFVFAVVETARKLGPLRGRKDASDD